MATPRLAGGKLSIKIACEMGCNAPPPAPCTMEAKIRKDRFGAAPQAKEATVKMPTQTMRNRLRPNKAENHAVAGRMTAFEMR